MGNIKERYAQGKKNLAPVVFIHGDIQNHTVFGGIERMMQALGHTTFSFDLPGHGLSKFSEEEKDLPSLLENLLIEKKIKNPILIGNSSGGTLAIDYVTRTGNVSSLVLFNSPLSNPRYMNPGFDWDAAAAMYIKLSRESFKGQRPIDYLSLGGLTGEEIRRIGLETTHPKGFENNVNFYINLQENKAIYDLDIPILLISSNQDDFVPSEYIRDSAGKIKNSRLAILEGGHHILLDSQKRITSLLEKNYSFFSGQEAQ